MLADTDASDTNRYHTPVLQAECLVALAPEPGKSILDATIGGGGHSAVLAEALQPGGTLIGIDRDTDALQAAHARLAPWGKALTIILIHTDFGKLDFALDTTERTKGVRLDGALFDLGVSSHQLDTARGFSFRRDEPLDMRMDATGSGQTAADLLATASEATLAQILWQFGEERWAKRIARRIVERRDRDKVTTTAQLAALVENSVPRAAWPKDIHVATRTFQALRIAVNEELEQLQAGLAAAVERLKPGGRIAVISYHSLEDRLVKQAFADWAGRTPNAPGRSPAAFLPQAESTLRLKLLTRKPIIPTQQETARNPRARSARMRVGERLP